MMAGEGVEVNLRQLFSRDLLELDKVQRAKGETLYDVKWDEVQAHLVKGPFVPEMDTHIKIVSDVATWEEVFSAQRTEDSSYGDLHFIMEEGYIPVHKVFLKGLSPFLDSLLNSVNLPCKYDVLSISLPDVKMAHLRTFLTLIYCGSAGISGEDDVHLRDIMRLLQIDEKKLSKVPCEGKKSKKVVRCLIKEGNHHVEYGNRATRQSAEIHSVPVPKRNRKSGSGQVDSKAVEETDVPVYTCAYCEVHFNELKELESHMNSFCAPDLVGQYCLEEKRCNACSEQHPNYDVKQFMDHVGECFAKQNQNEEDIAVIDLEESMEDATAMNQQQAPLPANAFPEAAVVVKEEKVDEEVQALLTIVKLKELQVRVDRLDVRNITKLTGSTQSAEKIDAAMPNLPKGRTYANAKPSRSESSASSGNWRDPPQAGSSSNTQSQGKSNSGRGRGRPRKHPDRVNETPSPRPKRARKGRGARHPSESETGRSRKEMWTNSKQAGGRSPSSVPAQRKSRRDLDCTVKQVAGVQEGTQPAEIVAILNTPPETISSMVAVAVGAGPETVTPPVTNLSKDNSGLATADPPSVAPVLEQNQNAGAEREPQSVLEVVTEENTAEKDKIEEEPGSSQNALITSQLPATTTTTITTTAGVQNSNGDVEPSSCQTTLQLRRRHRPQNQPPLPTPNNILPQLHYIPIPTSVTREAQSGAFPQAYVGFPPYGYRGTAETVSHHNRPGQGPLQLPTFSLQRSIKREENSGSASTVFHPTPVRNNPHPIAPQSQGLFIPSYSQMGPAPIWNQNQNQSYPRMRYILPNQASELQQQQPQIWHQAQLHPSNLQYQQQQYFVQGNAAMPVVDQTGNFIQ